MRGLILAGGIGTRLAATGVSVPKAAVPVANEPQIARLLNTFHRLHLSPIVAMMRADLGAAMALARAVAPPQARVAPCFTPSSFHTLALGLEQLPPGPVLCSMVDTVMRRNDWSRVYQETVRQLAAGADAVLAVTPFVDDERPLWVARDEGGMIQALSDEPLATPCVTGGVYGLGEAARNAAALALEADTPSMRGFLRAALTQGLKIGTVEIARIIDLDRKSDLDIANAWLERAP